MWYTYSDILELETDSSEVFTCYICITCSILMIQEKSIIEEFIIGI